MMASSWAARPWARELLLRVLVLVLHATRSLCCGCGCGVGACMRSLEVRFLLAGAVDAVKLLGPSVAELLAGRGGGRPGRFQGKGSGLGRVLLAQQAILNQGMPT